MENPICRSRSCSRRAADVMAGVMALVPTLFAPVAALAHSNEYLATLKGPNGGMLRMAEMYHFELGINRGEARIFVTDHRGEPQSTEGASGTLRLLSKGGAFTLALRPAGDNALVGKDPRIAALPDLRGILTVTMKNEKPLQARYVLDGKHAHARNH
jgi:hypothetical protein